MPNYSSLLSGYNTSLQNATTNYGNQLQNATTNYNNMQRDVMTEHGNAMARMQGGMHEPGRYNVLHGAGSRPGLTAGQPIMTSMRFGGFREKGGPVTPGKAYVVGEKEPEFFVPDVPGQIVPMYESMGGSSRLTPKFEDRFVNTQPRISTAEQLLQAARERLMNAGGAARMKMREQLEQGYGGQLGDGTYYPEDTSAVADYIRKTVPASQLVGMRRPDAGSVNSVRVVPGIGHMTEIQAARGYTDAGKVMTGNRGSGSVVFGGPRKPATFDGKTKEQFFGQAAARQGADNKYARAEKTGNVDELGNPKFTSKAIPKGNTATSERIYEAMKKGGAKGK